MSKAGIVQVSDSTILQMFSQKSGTRQRQQKEKREEMDVQSKR